LSEKGFDGRGRNRQRAAESDDTQHTFLSPDGGLPKAAVNPLRAGEDGGCGGFGNLAPLE